MNIQWYPGHMTKTRRMMEEDLKLVDAVCEILDARIPISSRNPDIDAICGKKPRMVILNRIDMADADLVSRWSNYFKDRGMAVIRTDCKSRKGINTFAPAVRQLLAEKLQRYAEKGQVGRPLKLMVVGIPNVGKSTLMNLLSKSDVFAENKLFATLDTTVRKIAIKNVPFLLADTVGFIRKLPHHLVESFKSTLDEVREADVILHVVDISHPQFEDQMKVVNATLAELIKEPKPTIIIFNKIDAFHYVQKEEDDLTPVTRENYSLNDLKQMWMSRQGSETVYISAVKKENIEELKEKLYDIVKEIHSARFPYNDFLYQDYTENNPETEE